VGFDANLRRGVPVIAGPIGGAVDDGVGSGRCAVFACALGVAASGASAHPLESLHSFTACLPSGECPIDNDGSHPNGAMVRGADDNLYGVAAGGTGGAFGSIYRVFQTPELSSIVAL
jgi:hypothetical protein